MQTFAESSCASQNEQENSNQHRKLRRFRLYPQHLDELTIDCDCYAAIVLHFHAEPCPFTMFLQPGSVCKIVSTQCSFPSQPPSSLPSTGLRNTSASTSSTPLSRVFIT